MDNEEHALKFLDAYTKMFDALVGWQIAYESSADLRRAMNGLPNRVGFNLKWATVSALKAHEVAQNLEKVD